MYEPQPVYHKQFLIERILYGCLLWNSLSERQQDNILDNYEGYENVV